MKNDGNDELQAELIKSEKSGLGVLFLLALYIGLVILISNRCQLPFFGVLMFTGVGVFIGALDGCGGGEVDRSQHLGCGLAVILFFAALMFFGGIISSAFLTLATLVVASITSTSTHNESVHNAIVAAQNRRQNYPHRSSKKNGHRRYTRHKN